MKIFKEVRSEIKSPLKPIGIQSKNWIVITTLSPPTSDVKFISSLRGWRVVVVGDVATPANWSYPNCDFLSLERQKKLNYLITDLVPEKSYSRKNIGYLYAIQHGAEVIYETDDDNRPLYGLKRFDYESEFSGLEFAGQNLFNPYHHFGQRTLWPRGFPLSAVSHESDRVYWMHKNMQTPLIQQGIVNGDPDMDAIFRLTRKRADRPLDVQFDSVAPTAVLPAGVFSPFNSQNTLFHQDAFWALLIPSGTTMRVCDIWRGYWAQRLLWEIGGRLAFYPPNAYQQRNSHNYLLDAIDELQLYTDTEKLITFLRQWICSPHLSFYGCVETLTLDLVAAGLWKARDMDVTKAWLADLRRVGYKEPVRKTIVWSSPNVQKSDVILGNNTLEECQKRPLTQASIPENNSSFAVFYPAEKIMPPMHSKDFSPMPKVLQHVKVTDEICSDFHFTRDLSNLSMTNKATNADFFNDILVVVTFHFSRFYHNIRYLEAAYRTIFPNLIYCGPNRIKFQAAMESLPHNRGVSFIETDVNCGCQAYSCILGAMQAGYNVKGYLYMGDDVLVNPWVFTGMNKSRVWATNSFHYTLDTNSPKKKWTWWDRPVGQRAFHLAVKDIRTKTPIGIKSWESMMKSVESAAGGSGLIKRGLSDLYYIPKRLQEEAKWYLSMFKKRSVFLEIAVPILLYGLEPASDIEALTGTSVSLERNHMWSFYNSSAHYVHPIKISQRSAVQSFCSNFIATMLKRLYGL
ncbi:conserved uncharacterized protein [Plakobranchus ocellatus]|uniref:Conserved uncharacterized protein n=1 Tax=Plakobranchus ocellatus TaxID=259542 RepID=A0AAV4A866_9GAST|nr:conserved uncharacterized protein [Plakobranchus ocellatus]